jgi:hypothetical protein
MQMILEAGREGWQFAKHMVFDIYNLTKLLADPRKLDGALLASVEKALASRSRVVSFISC